jgi:esterase/lipase
MPTIKRNIIVKGSLQRPMTLDLYLSHPLKKAPLILYAHGFKGFKDWGHTHLLAYNLAVKGFHFAKFNFSHNGTSPENLMEITDLEAFKLNTYEKEIHDLHSIENYLVTHWKEYFSYIISMGHSRGGSMSLLYGAESNQVEKIITLGAPAKLDFAWSHAQPDDIRLWKEKGYNSVINSRTQQSLPVGFDLYTNFYSNEERFDILGQTSLHNKEIILFHGKKDPVVSEKNANMIFSAARRGSLYLLPQEDHVFGSKFIWDKNTLPHFYQKLLDILSPFVE